MEFLKGFLGSSVFSVILGFCLGKWGNIWDDNRKIKEEGRQFLRNLMQEIMNNRVKCQAVIQHKDPIYFEKFSWDALRLSKHLSILSKDKDLLNSLHKLYIYIDSANLGAHITLTALDCNIKNRNTDTQAIANHANKIMIDSIAVDLLPKLSTLEDRLAVFLRLKNN